MKHIISADQFKPADLKKLFKRADEIRGLVGKPEDRRKLATRHQGKIVATLFYEPSTRTRLSFEAAAQRLGAGIISTENAGEFSSAVKGETIEDTVNVIDRYADVAVIRHPEKGSLDKAAGAAVNGLSLVNAGDGQGEHPTQALLDMYTIKREAGRLDSLVVALGGGLAGNRTARSLAYLLSKFKNNEIVFVAPDALKIDKATTDYLKKVGMKYSETEDLKEGLEHADVIYWNRVKKEYLRGVNVNGQYKIGTREMKYLKPDAVLMHALPRVDEISQEVDKDPRAKYFDQAENGLYIRMALLDRLLAG